MSSPLTTDHLHSTWLDPSIKEAILTYYKDHSQFVAFVQPFTVRLCVSVSSCINVWLYYTRKGSADVRPRCPGGSYSARPLCVPVGARTEG